MFAADPQGTTTGARIGPFRFAPGWSRANAATLWLASLLTIGSVAFMTFVQPYLLTEVLAIPRERQGTLTGLLGTFQETIVILMAGVAGAWSDRVGRRTVFCLGLLLVAIGYAIYPLASAEWQLALLRLPFAIGVGMAPLMLSACVADSPQEISRGRWAGSNNLLQGVGVVLMSVVLARAPAWFAGHGAAPPDAARYTYWTAALLCLLTAAILWAGLPRTVPDRVHAAPSPLGAKLKAAWTAGLGNPRLLLAYGAAFIGRGDFTVIGAFFSLWLMHAGIEAGMDAGTALRRAGMLFGVIQLSAVAWALVMGFIADRVNRVTAICFALAAATVGYVALGGVDDPFSRAFLPVAVLVGIGEVSVIVASSALLGQEALPSLRGAIVGFFNAVGGIGILFATGVGGLVYDRFGETAPFLLMGTLNGVLLLAAIAVRLRAGEPVLVRGRDVPGPQSLID